MKKFKRHYTLPFFAFTFTLLFFSCSKDDDIVVINLQDFFGHEARNGTTVGTHDGTTGKQQSKDVTDGKKAWNQ